MGELDIAPALYERMTWRDFEYKARGYFLRLARHKWMIREMIWNIWATHGEDIDRREIMTLPWDAPEETTTFKREFTEEELADIDRRFTSVQVNTNQVI